MDIANYPWPAGNIKWGPRDLAALMHQRIGLDSRLDTAVAVVLAESGGDPLETGRAVWAPGQVTHLSVDLGMFQLNSYYHTVTGPYPTVPPITVAACFDPKLAWNQAWEVLQRDRPDNFHWNWKPWTVYTSGAYDAHLASARGGVTSLRTWLAAA